MLFFTSEGRVFSKKVHELPEIGPFSFQIDADWPVRRPNQKAELLGLLEELQVAAEAQVAEQGALTTTWASFIDRIG